MPNLRTVKTRFSFVGVRGGFDPLLGNFYLVDHPLKQFGLAVKATGFNVLHQLLMVHSYHVLE
jgi:hypothetical protein